MAAFEEMKIARIEERECGRCVDYIHSYPFFPEYSALPVHRRLSGKVSINSVWSCFIAPVQAEGGN